MAGDGDLASRRLCQQVALASDHDFAFQLQLNEAIQASLRAHTPNRPSSRAAAAATAFCSCSSCQPVSALWSSEVALAELARQEKNRRDAQAFRAAHAQANTSARVASRGALLARELAGTPDLRRAHGGDLLERPLDPSRSPSSRVFYKGLSNKEGAGGWWVVPGPRVAVLAVVVYDPQGKVVRTIQKRVERFVGGRMELEVLALKEGIQAALELGIRWVNIVSDFKALHKYMLGTWRPTKNKSEHLVNEALSRPSIERYPPPPAVKASLPLDSAPHPRLAPPLDPPRAAASLPVQRRRATASPRPPSVLSSWSSRRVDLAALVAGNDHATRLRRR
ncbi:uncharacterized protein [Triticum aestivum]|uniref:uncharacterized protein n=1 Tax=Triticum aestivum TaxID=4565 RepID=UPI001D025E32|nr:uncharacterized protein LOC123170961 [Triticum aestivum]